MSFNQTLILCILTTLFSHITALTLPLQPQPRSNCPFNQLVAFGDELSDNGNGSYAHGITGSPANVYGFGTWTNGPVAVSYLVSHCKSQTLDSLLPERSQEMHTLTCHPVHTTLSPSPRLCLRRLLRWRFIWRHLRQRLHAIPSRLAITA